VDQVDCIVVGAGVTGLASARALAMRGLEVLVLEAEAAIGRHASSRSSEVIHAGIYYPPHSAKARLCVAGRELLYAYCAERGIAHRRTGKLIVAVTQAEVRQLEQYRARALANGVADVAWLTSGQVLGLEPALHCVRALWSPSTGILDSHQYLLSLRADIETAGGSVVLNTRVTGARPVERGFEVTIDGSPAISCRYLVNAAGLCASRLAGRIETLAPAQVPVTRFARGQYFALQGDSPFRHLVYPLAEDTGLGIHVTVDLAGAARFGPDVQWIDDIDYGFDESRRQRFATAIRRYYPALEEARLVPGYTGIRARIHGPDEPPADFLIQGPAGHGLRGLVNLFGIESPGLTASLAIGAEVARLLD
jgi:L-2-hydroxyglutarate oxidase LhgO